MRILLVHESGRVQRDFHGLREVLGGRGEEQRERNKEDIVEKCVKATSALRKCMEAHSDYYAPLLDAEEAMMKQLEEEEKSNDADKKESP